MGAMIGKEDERWRETEESLVVAVAVRGKKRRMEFEANSLPVV